jgi:hypothetical protein
MGDRRKAKGRKADEQLTHILSGTEHNTCGAAREYQKCGEV